MGYTTEFDGQFDFSRPLTVAEYNSLLEFTKETHYEDPRVPGVYCQWVPSNDGRRLKWDGHEKFYAYKEWLEYLISRFFSPWGITLSGSVDWQGEDPSDFGVLSVENNVVKATKGRQVVGDGEVTPREASFVAMLKRVVTTCHLSEDETLHNDIVRLIASVEPAYAANLHVDDDEDGDEGEED